MPPVLARRSASIPTLVSLSKLFHLVPAALKSRHAERSTEWAVTAAALAMESSEGGEGQGTGSVMFKLVFSMFLVLLGGVFAGLTLALMGSDDLNLRVLAASSDDPKERADAHKVLRLLNRGRHWVLVVLLLANVIVNESLPIFLHDVFGDGVYAVAVSTIMIVIFGEVIPQAVCVRYGLAIGGACAPLVHAMMIIFAPVAWPLAKLLDWILGHDSGHTYKKAELKSFLQFHREGEEPLRDDEITILNGVLSLNDRRVKEIMTPIDDCLVLPADKILDHDLVDRILISGFSRIPIHEPGQPDNFIGMLLVKRLITYNPDDNYPVNRFTLNSLPEATPDLNCFQALDYFQTGRAHLLLISDTPGQRGGALGILSLEDLIEEIIGEEIIDETDRYEDNHSKRTAQRRATREIMRGIIERQRVINAFSRRPSGHGQGSSSRTESPNPGPREGILVNLGDGVEQHIGSSLKKELKVDENGDLAVFSKSPDDMHNIIVEQPAAKAGDPEMVGDSAPPAPESSDSDKTAIMGETPIAVGAVKASADLVDDPIPETPIEPPSDVPETPTSDSAPSETTKTKKSNGKRRKEFLEPFPSPESFKAAAQTFMVKYEGKERVLGPERTNVGWEWKTVSSKWRGEQGYMARRSVVHAASTSDSADAELEEDDDPAAAPPVTGQRIELDLSVVYSPTYLVPMLCLRAWNQHGVPLTLTELVEHVLRASPPTEAERADAIMLPGAPFPLLQQTEHPVTGDMVWSVHPCEVRAAVAEVVQSEMDDESQSPDTTALPVRWLEAWFMLSDSVVNLSL